MDVLGWELVGSGCVGLRAGRQWMCWVDGELVGSGCVGLTESW